MNKNYFVLCLFISLFIVGCERDSTPSSVAEVPEQAQTCADEKAVIVPNLGDYGRDIHSALPQAQAYFDQGLRLTFSYYFPEALASFDAALCFDPLNPMIHWGRALAIAPNPNSRYGGVPDDPEGEGWNAIQQAQRLAAANPIADVDQGLINALAVLFSDQDGLNELEARNFTFIGATTALYQLYPQDLEVAFLAADAIMMATPWQYFSTVDGSAINGADKARRYLETGIEQNPMHPGLNHLHIHLMENSFSPEAAETSADRLESLTPIAGHMVHMPGHIYMRLGRYADSIATNQRSLAADKNFAAAWGELTFPSGATYGLSHRVHAPHAQNFIHWGAVLQGNSELALATIQPMAEGIGAERLESGGAQRTIANYWMTLGFFQRWQDILDLKIPEDWPPYLQGIYQFVQGSAYANTNRLAAGRAAHEKLAEILTDPRLVNQRASVNLATDLLQIAQHLLAGDIARSENNLEQAVTSYQLAVAAQDNLRYMEPPDWLQSTRLSLGNAYLDAENYTAAEFIFTEDLALLRENGWALYGLLQSLQSQNLAEEIEQVAERFGKAWQYADVDLGSF